MELTRAVLATVLYRAVGWPAVYGNSGFANVRPGQWYSDAVTWADGAGVMQGYGNGLFGLNDPVIRERLMVLLARFRGENTAWTGDPAFAAVW